MMAREREKSSSDDEAKKTQLMELPIDILVDILLKLPAKSVGCIKCVSRTLLKSVSNISFSTIHTRSHIAANSTAAAADADRLMCCFRDDRFVTLQSLKYKDNTLTKGRYAITVSSSTSAPWFPRFVFHNVFCLGTKNGDCILVNALAGERGLLRLPESSFARMESGLPNVFRRSLFGMGFDDETNTYKIVRVIHESDAQYHQLKSITAHVLVLGTNSWRQIFSHPPCQLRWTTISNAPICANGAVHWLTRSTLVDDDRKLLSFNLRKEEFCWTPTRHQYFETDVIRLFSLRGCLAIVETTRSRSRTEIWVLKSEQQQWVRYYRYNNKLPYDFPCDSSSLGEWEHGIFFTSHRLPDKWAVFFIDIRFGSISRVEYPYTNTYLLGLYEYSETLISLKDYGDLEEAHHQVIG